MSGDSSHASAGGRPLFVSLSGGGIRATLFAIGALIALDETRERDRVAVVSSVSGGSIANAIMATTPRAGSATSPFVRERMLRAAEAIRKRGVFLTLQWPLLIASIFATSVLMALVALWLRSAISELPEEIWTGWKLFVTAFWVWIGVNVCIVVGGRRRWQRDAYAGTLASFAESDGARPRSRRQATAKWLRKRLSDLPDAAPLHVFCATDLDRAEPVFLTRSGMIDVDGRTSAPELETLTIVRAVYASAAFPLFFSAERTGIVGGRSLVDGGVYNNLGTSWEDVPGRLGLDTYPGGADRLIVNASRPALPKKTGRYWHPFILWRSFEILNDNTVRPRLAGYRAESGYAISDIAVSLRAQLVALTKLKNREDVAARATELLSTWAESAEFTTLDDASTRTVLVGTHLSRVSRHVANSLLAHGYLSAFIALHCEFGNAAIPDLGTVPTIRET